MKVFKFGGASASTIDRIKNIPAILELYKSDRIVMIISAMGKTTNALEKVVEAFYAGNKEMALDLFNAVKQQHLTTAKYLLVTHYSSCYNQLNDYFTEAEWLLHDKPVREFDYYYDQVVCVGELLSTCIISFYLNEVGVSNTLIDVRDILKTDSNFREANIDWKKTNENITLFTETKTNLIITQGFVGCTDDNESTTLGREGSDYTAAIFANLLNAENVTIWKDVEGVMNADPKALPDAILISELSFNEVIEMAYYGAQVIHPKTIKPLQNKGIPLQVKCFLDPSLPGTVIHKKNIKNLPPIIVVKDNQALIHLHSQDFSFVGEEPIAKLYKIFAQLNIKPNLIQTGAISLQIGLDNREDKIQQLATAASAIFDVQVEKGLQLLTIRHYTQDLYAELVKGKDIILTQQTKDTIQSLYK
jgi:aspartate kinase